MRDPRRHSSARAAWRGLRGAWRIWLPWLVALVLLALDWHASAPHHRFGEPMPLALGNGPAADAGHCSLAPTK
ncbi:hypothetical protein [Thiomonas sp.]|jgi:hypothetical protein|uniref:hypothetical protein n=1 Tax=Thiomonas sp. TaxID=2047785 RepID=UPI00260D0A45|nr:hypothetical protein [Thiomonas sp.]